MAIAVDVIRNVVTSQLVRYYFVDPTSGCATYCPYTSAEFDLKRNKVIVNGVIPACDFFIPIPNGYIFEAHWGACQDPREYKSYSAVIICKDIEITERVILESSVGDDLPVGILLEFNCDISYLYINAKGIL